MLVLLALGAAVWVRNALLYRLQDGLILSLQVDLGTAGAGSQSAKRAHLSHYSVLSTKAAGFI